MNCADCAGSCSPSSSVSGKCSTRAAHPARSTACRKRRGPIPGVSASASHPCRSSNETVDLSSRPERGSRSESRGAEGSAFVSSPTSTQILPRRISHFDQCHLFLSPPALDLLFSGDRVVHILKSLKPHQPPAAVLRRESVALKLLCSMVRRRMELVTPQ